MGQPIIIGIVGIEFNKNCVFFNIFIVHLLFLVHSNPRSKVPVGLP